VKTFSAFVLSSLLLASASPAAPASGEQSLKNVVGGELVVVTTLAPFGLSAYLGAGKEINPQLLQADAAQALAGGLVSASLEEAFAELRQQPEFRNLSDQALATAILENF
jgi:hypothetical protein